MINKRWVM